MAQSEGKARVRDLSLVSESTEDRLSAMQRALEEERVRRDGHSGELRQALESMSREMEDRSRTLQENHKEAMLRIAGDQGKIRGELNEVTLISNRSGPLIYSLYILSSVGARNFFY